MTIAMAPAEFGTRFRSLLTDLYGRLAPDAGETEAEIALAETRIGQALPTMLRLCHKIAGRPQRANQRTCLPA